jgi:hypothetical protein
MSCQQNQENQENWKRYLLQSIKVQDMLQEEMGGIKEIDDEEGWDNDTGEGIECSIEISKIIKKFFLELYDGNKENAKEIYDKFVCAVEKHESNYFKNGGSTLATMDDEIKLFKTVGPTLLNQTQY